MICLREIDIWLDASLGPVPAPENAQLSRQARHPTGLRPPQSDADRPDKPAKENLVLVLLGALCVFA